MTDPDALYAGWYVWARRNLSNDVAVCHAAAAAAAAVEAAGGPREQAIAAARQSTTSGAHLAAADAGDRRRRTYAEWFDWARRELGGLGEQQAAAARAALAALEAGAGPEAAQRAARSAAGLAKPAPERPPDPVPPPPPSDARWSIPPGPPPPGWAPAPVAGVGWRLGAYAIDYAVLLGGLVLMAVFAGVLLGLAGAAAGSTTPPSSQSLQVPLWILSLVGSWLYYTLLESSAWQGTLGKRLLHLRVSDEAGGRISWARANGRYFAKILSSLACGLGYLWAAFNPRRQGWHDLLAKTLVLRS